MGPVAIASGSVVTCSLSVCWTNADGDGVMGSSVGSGEGGGVSGIDCSVLSDG